MTGFAILLAAAAVAFGVSRRFDMAPIPFLVVAGMVLARIDAFPVEMLQDALIYGLTVVLFVSGTELSPSRVRGQRAVAVEVGIIQFGVIALAGTGIALLLGYARLTGDPIGSGDPWAPLEIPQTNAAPELDGTRGSEWDTAVRIELNKVSGADSQMPTDLSDLNPSAHLMFDADYLYVYYETPDEALFNDSGNTWQDDSFDLVIDAGNEKTQDANDDNDAQFEFGYAATEVTGNGVPNFSAGIEFVSVETADGYAIEARVPWANFSVNGQTFVPYNQRLIGLEVKANDDDEGGDTRQTKAGWFEDSDEAWRWAHVLGTAKLVGTIVENAAEPEPGLPERFAIESVYPNPFNPSTTAIVAIREVGDYDVRIYNVIGQLVEKQRVSAQVPGRMEITFDFGRYASGLYLISVKNLQTGKVVSAKAMLAK